jgi:N,N-dimethylformamidase beta subunit-like protein
MLETYCTRRSYVAGDNIDLHLSTDAGTVDLIIVRDGLDPQTVLEVKQIAGSVQPIPKDVVENGCAWPVGFTFSARPDWKSGFYKVVLTSAKGDRAEAFFVLRATQPTASILWVIETNTWNAYNFFGGASTYTADGSSYSGGAPRVSFLRPLPRGFVSLPDNSPRMATVGVVDKTLPYARWATALGLTVWTGAASWGQWGSKFAAWLDAEGIEVDYAVNSDLQEFPDILQGYKMMLSVGHDEYWSWPMRNCVEAFIAGGGNVAFFSANTSYWQVRLEKDLQQMVAFKAAVDSDPVIGTAQERQNTGIWSHRLTQRPENQMTGVSFSRGGYARVAGVTPASAGGYTLYRDKHWALEGSGLSYGDQLGGPLSLIGYECDGCELQFKHGLPYPSGSDGTPVDFEIIAIAPVALFSRENSPEWLYPVGVMTDLELVSHQILGKTDAASLATLAHGHAVMGSYVAPGGGTVFTAGTTEWACCLGDPQVACITRTVIKRLS